MNKNFSKKIDTLTGEISKLWKKNLPAEDVLEDIFQRVESCQLAGEFSQNDLLSYAIHNEIYSAYLAGSFSDFNLTLRESEFFRIDLYCWGKRKTGIHSHPFVGCFFVMEGQTVQNQYKFIEEYKGEGYSLGELTLNNQKILKPGEGQVISLDEKLVHDTVYIESPTVSLCIRSKTDFDVPNYNYKYPGLRYIKEKKSEAFFKQIELFNYIVNNVSVDSDHIDDLMSRFKPHALLYIYFNQGLLSSLLSIQSQKKIKFKIEEYFKDFDLKAYAKKNDDFMNKMKAFISKS